MEDSFLIELLGRYLFPFYEKLIKENPEELAQIESLRAELKKTLNEEQFDLCNTYKHKCLLREEYIDFQMNIKYINYGVKIGMQLQKAFDEED